MLYRCCTWGNALNMSSVSYYGVSNAN